MATELYAATGGQGDEWRQAAALGIGIDPRNPLYAEPIPGDDAPPPAPVKAASAPAPASQFGNAASSLNFGMSSLGLNTGTAPAEDRPMMTQTAIENAMAKTAVEHARTDPMPSSPTPPGSAPSMDLDFDLGNSPVAPLRAATTAPTDENADLTASASGNPLIDPFTASAFGSSPDSAARTAVNLPAFRARAEPTPAPASPRDADGFTASDIFGSSIIADNATMYGETPPEPMMPVSVPERMATKRSDERDHLANRQFDKTEPLDAFNTVNLDLDQDYPSSGGTSTDFGAKTDVWQAMATKLDLALAYSDIGDKDGARELLEEVVRNGDQVQSDRARQLITDLG
jgi:pilus assembly protein FimV